MACDRCRKLNTEHRIVVPDDLRRVIGMVAQAIIDRVLVEVQRTPAPYCLTPFQELASGGFWDDIVSYDFRCCHCGQEFHLGAETYHGRGGAWRPVRGNA